MKPGHLDTAIRTELGHINTIFYWFINLKMNVDYKTTLICGQPNLDCIVAYLYCFRDGVGTPACKIRQVPAPGTKIRFGILGLRCEW